MKTAVTLDDIKNIIFQQKPYLTQKYGVAEIGIFGSYIRGDQQSGSDLDILIELERPARIGLWDLVELRYELSDLLGVPVDIAIKKNLKPRIGRHILREAVML